MTSMKIEQHRSTFICEKFIFSSDFDSGNLYKVELLRKNTFPNINDSVQNLIEPQQQLSQNSNNVSQINTTNATINSNNNTTNPKERQIDLEFNLWTRPDNFCIITPSAESSKKCRNLECNGSCGNLHHGNRTWFFFSICGGEKNQLVKLNLVNLNKQAKLFSQGMHPVMRIGLNGKWERTKEKPTFQLTDENFILSFCHRTGENIDENITFYAFTFPWTYTEHINALDSYDKKYGKDLDELDMIVRELNQPYKEKIVIDINQTVSTFTASESCEKERSQLSLTSSDDAHDGSFMMQDKFESFQVTGKSMSSSVDENTSDSMQQLSSLVNNVKIEKVPEILPTVTRIVVNTDDLKNDIYYYRELLVNSVEQRRIDLLTVSSFDGIEEEREERVKNLFPDISTPRCHKFKNKKIIFISSRVHPGETPSSFVLNGFLNLLLDRKSQIASILRKMYVFKIIPFLNPDGVYNGLYRSDTLGHNLNRVYLNPKLEKHPSIYAVRKLIRFYHFGCDKTEGEIFEPIDMDNEKDLSNLMSICQEQTMQSEELNDFDSLGYDKEENMNSNPSRKLISNNDESGSENFISTDTSSCDRKHISNINVKARCNVNKKLKDTAMTVRNMMSNERKNYMNKNDSKLNHYKHMISHYNCEKSTEKLIQMNAQNQQNLNISLDYRIKTDENGDKSITDEKTNLFLYIDLHGHASKKGVFMYGNHLTNIFESVEVMLLPKLMSLNCHHFHFDACNFSERNMYLKGRRDGLSKEGSGRVAIYKATGLIKCYTLESNYNMAKCVNILPPKGKEITSKMHNLIPPKFTPQIFEEVGRALGPSLLDLTNSNPLSRVQNSEFRSLQGLRNALKNEIHRGLSRARINKFSKMPKKRQTSITLASTTNNQDPSKENDCIKPSSSALNVPISLASSSSSTSQNSHQPSMKSQISSVLKVTPSNKGSSGSSSGSKIPTFLKKDSLVNKKKILRENVTTALVNQIPHKKIRVSSSSNTNTLSTNPDKESSSCYGNDSEMPCCSRYIYQKAPSSPSSGSSTSSNGQMKITTFMPIKKVGVVKYGASSSNKTASSSLSGHSKKGRNILEHQTTSENPMSAPTFHSLSEKLIKKKKRLLKSETTTLKRKKSRPQKPLV